MKKIVLIGAGQIGSRHLQGLAGIAVPAEIAVVDPVEISLKMSQERFALIPRSPQLGAVTFHTDLSETPDEIDLVIVATSADMRFAIIQDLLATKTFSNIILEKIVFQSEKHFTETLKLFSVRKIKAWVNCPRRIYPFYRSLKDLFKAGEKLTCSVEGGDWGLGCNSLHFLDLLAYLNGTAEFDIDISRLTPGSKESKRKGFVEFTGTLAGRAANGSSIILSSGIEPSAPVVISIQGETFRLMITEGTGTAIKEDISGNGIREKIEFSVPRQSELTGCLATEILGAGTCGLTTLAESARLHKSLLEAFCTHLAITSGKKVEICPIT